jgi:hypothetical protein
MLIQVLIFEVLIEVDIAAAGIEFWKSLILSKSFKSIYN